MTASELYPADEMAIMAALVDAHRDELGLPEPPSPLEVARRTVRRIGRVAGVLWRFGKAHTPKWLLPVLAVCLVIPGPVDELAILAVVLVPVLRSRSARQELAASVRTAWNFASEEN